MVRQTVLFTPGDERRMVEKAISGDADMVILDIEDAVAPSAKADAGRTIRDVLREYRDEDIAVEVAVRINPLESRGEEDLSIISDVGDQIQNVVLPKVDGVETIDRLSELLAAYEFDAAIIPVIETPASLIRLPEIAEHPLVDALEFGAEDFTTEIGATHTSERDEILYARQRIVAVAAAAGIDALDMAWPDFRDTEGLRKNAETAVQYGYDGKSAIHPIQLDVIEDVFRPDEEEVEWAREVLAEAETAQAEGKVVFELDGEMIDPPIIERARSILERAGHR